MHPTCVFIFLWFLVFNLIQTQKLGCLHFDLRTNATWQLVFLDTFDSYLNLTNNWVIKDHTCENPSSQCLYSRENLHLLDGYLVMIARSQSAVSSLNFTGSHLISRRPLGPRSTLVQVRAFNPARQNIKVDIFTSFGQSSKETSILIDRAQEYSITRGSTSISNENSILDRQDSEHFPNLHQYATYWNPNSVQFTIDGDYFYQIPLDSKKIIPPQQLHLSVGVLDINQSPVLPSEPEFWRQTCPSLVVDYVRVFERVEAKENKDEPKCVFAPESSDDEEEIETIRNICLQFGRHKTVEIVTSRSHWYLCEF